MVALALSFHARLSSAVLKNKISPDMAWKDILSAIFCCPVWMA
jgi:hypothetical protein